MAMRTPSARHWRAELMRFSPSRSILGCCAAKSTRGSNELPDRVTCHCALKKAWLNTGRTGVPTIASTGGLFAFCLSPGSVKTAPVALQRTYLEVQFYAVLDQILDIIEVARSGVGGALPGVHKDREFDVV